MIRDRIFAAREAIKLVWRCWRISREYGIPFEDVFELHIRAIDVTMEELIREHVRRTRHLN